MNTPPLGYHYPVERITAIDGGTVDVQVHGYSRNKVLQECFPPPVGHPLARESREYLQRLLSEGFQSVTLFEPYKQDGVRLFIGERDINEEMAGSGLVGRTSTLAKEMFQ